MLTRKAKNSLKFKAAPKEVILKIKTPGNRITTVKTTGRILQKGEYAFVSIPAIFQLTKNGKEIESEEESRIAALQLSPVRKSKKRTTSTQKHEELILQIQNLIPDGFKFNGTKLVKTRTRQKKSD